MTDFAAMCLHQQYCPIQLQEAQHLLLPTPTGRVTIQRQPADRDDRWRARRTELPDEAARAAALWERFGVSVLKA
ncbi:MAG: hypothetical protein U0841_30765 [Chloroflexia bacterium]